MRFKTKKEGKNVEKLKLIVAAANKKILGYYLFNNDWRAIIVNADVSIVERWSVSGDYPRLIKIQ